MARFFDSGLQVVDLGLRQTFLASQTLLAQGNTPCQCFRRGGVGAFAQPLSEQVRNLLEPVGLCRKQKRHFNGDFVQARWNC